MCGNMVYQVGQKVRLGSSILSTEKPKQTFWPTQHLQQVSLVAQLVKNLPAMQETCLSAGDLGSTPGRGRSPGEGNGTSLQCSCLENPMDRRAWWATVHGVSKSRTQLRD